MHISYISTGAVGHVLAALPFCGESVKNSSLQAMHSYHMPEPETSWSLHGLVFLLFASLRRTNNV